MKKSVILKMVVVFLTILCLGINSFVPLRIVRASSNDLSNEIIVRLLTTPLYTVVEVNQSPIIENSKNDEVNEASKLNDLIRYYSALPKEELLKQIEASIEQAAGFEKSGAKIFWNKKFLEDIIRPNFPDICSKVTNLQKSDSENNTRSIPINVLSTSFTPGSNIVIGQEDGYSPVGIHLYTFYSRIYWAWDSSKITSVLPTTWGEVHCWGWHYEGVTANQQYFSDNNTVFHKWIKGQFHLYVVIKDLPLDSYAYPMLNFTLYAGGQYNWYGSN